jgi:hypothetical protein
MAQQGEGQESVRDGGAVGRIPLCTIEIQMDPLPVFGGFGKLLDGVLGDREPVGSVDLTADQLFQGVKIFFTIGGIAPLST